MMESPPSDTPFSDDDRQSIEDQATFRDDSPVARAIERELLRGLAPPPGHLPQRRYLPGELFDLMPWSGHRVEVLAVPLVTGSRIPASHPWAFDRFPDIEGPCLIARWKIGQPPQAGFLEVTWHRRRHIRRLIDSSGTLTPIRAFGLWSLWGHGVQAPVPKGARPRWFDLDQAVRAARTMLAEDPPVLPTVELIAEQIGHAEGIYLPLSTLTSRWQRHKRDGTPAITIEEVLERARR
jgi:hypothetical protein